jgi:hypothetical protein
LPETATEDEIVKAFTTLTAQKPTDLTALTAEITSAKAELTALKSANANAVALSAKAEIDNLMAEASRNGQAVPLASEELYEVKDGICTIKMQPAQLSKIVARIQKNTVALSKTAKPAAPADKDGQPLKFDRRTPEGREQMKAWCLSKQAENAPEIGRQIIALSSNN